MFYFPKLNQPIAIIFFGIFLVLLFTSCLSPSHVTTQSASSLPKASTPGVNCSTLRGVATRPSSVCGKQGWEYLWTVYYKPMCSSCHSVETQSIGKTLFADSDLDTAYNSAIAILATPLVSTSIKNQFIEVCNMQVGEQLYNDLLYWSDHRVACP